MERMAQQIRSLIINREVWCQYNLAQKESREGVGETYKSVTQFLELRLAKANPAALKREWKRYAEINDERAWTTARGLCSSSHCRSRQATAESFGPESRPVSIRLSDGPDLMTIVSRSTAEGDHSMAMQWCSFDDLPGGICTSWQVREPGTGGLREWRSRNGLPDLLYQLIS